MHVAILIYDEPGSALRDQYRQAHLDYLKVFDAQTLFAGPFTTDDESADLGSLRLIESPDRATADRHVAEEPYVIGGVQKRWYIHRWLPRVPYSWRDCPRTRGHIQAMFHGLDQPGAGALPEVPCGPRGVPRQTCQHGDGAWTVGERRRRGVYRQRVPPRRA